MDGRAHSQSSRTSVFGLGPDQNFTPEGQAPITVVLVDDEHLIRAALARALSDSGIELVGEAVNGEDAIEIVVDVRPDVVLMDLRLPGLSGVEAIERLGLLAPASRVLVLTRSEQNRVVEAIIAHIRTDLPCLEPTVSVLSGRTSSIRLGG